MLESSKVPALTRAIDILNLIARIGPCSAATIIDTLGIPKSTAYLLLNELRRQRFLSEKRCKPSPNAGGDIRRKARRA
ncbi:helix-turn-helix domain-containing protein, partial [Escherichia coli]|uniref:helix-turn-helix domain-containing protein n=1 Tax=Escherichia coli TaxID=562 RepID=UPI001FCEBBD4